jgi:hypothetical protein
MREMYSVKKQVYKSLTIPSLVLSGTPTIKAKSINQKWSNTELQGSSPKDSKTNIVLLTCLAGAVLQTGVKMVSLWWYKA